jgi:hypothetical protein
MTGHEQSEGKFTYGCTPPLTLVLDGGGWSMSCSAILHLARYPVPIVQKAGWDPELLWIGMENFVQTGDSTPDCSAHSITSQIKPLNFHASSIISRSTDLNVWLEKAKH